MIFPEAKSLIKSIEEFEDELHKAEQQDEQTLKIKYGVDPKDLNALVDLKSLAALSQQILSQDKNAEALQQSISKEKLNFSDPLANKDMQIIIQAATKEKDDLLIHSALLFALRGTYFPESYFTQEAFQLIVTGDQPISQVLSLMVNDYLRKGNPDKFQNINELRKHLIETHKDLFTKANTFTHLISLGEQLGYFIHKIETPEPLDSKTFMKGGKYLHRFAFSFEATMRDLQQDSPFTHRLNAVANVLSTYQRGKIFIQPERIESDLQAFITKASPDLDPAEIKKIAASCTQYVLQKLFQELTSPQQQKEACLEIFKDHPHLKKALDAKESSDGIITSDEKMTLLLNALIGKARHENEVIRRHFDHEFREACSALKLTTESEIQAFLDQMVTAYVMAIKMFYQKPENKFDPYSLNYNEISLMHTFDPADIIPEE
ncbi:MAG: hypothetical protein KBB83_01115 [Alphaproteobacteria bacterium]|nr:hypothetical protein [Alphaproteobacteria bacterium]